MRTPVRSETEAFRLAVGTALVAGLSVLVGWLSEPLVGVAVFAVAFAAGAIAYLRAPNPDRRPVLRDAAHAPHSRHADPDARHVLVVANEVLSGAELRDRLKGDGRRVEVDVLAPVLTSRVHLGVTDIDREREEARSRLERSLAWAREQGIPARGEIGRDPSPLVAIEDELRDYGPDEVIVVTHASDRETWQERGEVERLQRELDLPVAHVVVGDGSAA